MDTIEYSAEFPLMNNFLEETQILTKTFEQKNHDYGNSFNDLCDEYGLIAAVIRLQDKVNRLKTLSRNPQFVKNESILDTARDLANYAILTSMWLKNEDKK